MKYEVEARALWEDLGTRVSIPKWFELGEATKSVWRDRAEYGFRPMPQPKEGDDMELKAFFESRFRGRALLGTYRDRHQHRDVAVFHLPGRDDVAGAYDGRACWAISLAQLDPKLKKEHADCAANGPGKREVEAGQIRVRIYGAADVPLPGEEGGSEAPRGRQGAFAPPTAPTPVPRPRMRASAPPDSAAAAINAPRERRRAV